MDTQLLRTFLEVRKTRHFANAGDNLCITQAAVSARIRQLEEFVGQRLFVRNRNDIRLTPAGHRLVPYAEAMLDTWSRALVDVSAIDQPIVSIGCLPSLREIYLDRWLLDVLADDAGWRINLESLSTLEIVAGIRDGTLNIGLLYDAPRSKDLEGRQIVEFELLLVSTEPCEALSDGVQNYVRVNWGTSVAHSPDAAPFPPVPVQTVVDSALLARKLLLAHGGSALLPEPLVREDLKSGRLTRVSDSPSLTRRVFAVTRRDALEDCAPVSALLEHLSVLASGRPELTGSAV